ncbi:hypothetical protein ACN2XU_19795 [Primorskyibacter sp. 2E107]|uniref:hypothetical protein n=1 Tax=Primorskyibacter sp. 2E107 TaxID=3403458 RepID=UPI003AF7D7D1
MLSVLHDILEQRPDAYARALAIAEGHIDRSGGAWVGVGTKGSILLLKGGSYADPAQGRHFVRAGAELLDAALAMCAREETDDAQALVFVSGCAYAATAQEPGHFDLARRHLARSDYGRRALPDWCADWCAILMSQAALEIGDKAASKAYFQKVSERDPQEAARLYELWTNRKS